MSALTRKVDKLNIMLAQARETLAWAKILGLTKEQVTELEDNVRLLQKDINYLMSSI